MDQMEINILSRTDSVIGNFLAELRDAGAQKDPMRFRKNVERIGMLLAYEVSKRLAYKPVELTTPLAPKTCRTTADSIVVGTIMRAGLPMHTGVLEVFDRAESCFVSAFRAYDSNHNVEIHLGYAATPSLDGKVLIMADPMLATGFSMMQTLTRLLEFGKPSHVHILSIIGAQEGVDYVRDNPIGVPTTLWVADVDPVLNADKYIVPGLGDAGDLCFGCKL